MAASCVCTRRALSGPLRSSSFCAGDSASSRGSANPYTPPRAVTATGPSGMGVSASRRRRLAQREVEGAFALAEFAVRFFEPGREHLVDADDSGGVERGDDVSHRVVAGVAVGRDRGVTVSLHD